MGLLCGSFDLQVAGTSLKKACPHDRGRLFRQQVFSDQ
jgi:hypothetical protein